MEKGQNLRERVDLLDYTNDFLPNETKCFTREDLK